MSYDIARSLNVNVGTLHRDLSTFTDPVPEAFEFSPDWRPISEEEQPGDSHVFLHEVVFLIDRRSSVARSTGTLLRTVNFRKIYIKILNK